MELRRDLHVYHRRLKLLDHFEYESDYPRIPFTNPSVWEPKLDQVSETVQTLIRKDLNSFSRFRPRPHKKQNLTKQHWQALKGLSSNPSIVIKPADKGSQIVIMDKVQYLLEANKQLNNIKHYTPLPHSIQLETQVRIRDIVRTLYEQKYIVKKQMSYLMGPDSPRPRQLYLLPKIHKAPEKWTVPFQVPCGRPIVSDCGSESYNIAEYIDFYINPLSQKHRSYVKDTYEFVNKLKSLSIPAQAFFFSIDINSLYTNIETELGLQAVAEAFQKHPDPSRPDKAILELLELSLNRNDFEFNGKHYLQIHGTAMGKKFAPAFANLYMSLWEETAFLKCKALPLLYLRYLDDIFGLWIDSISEFHEFLGILDSHHLAITITHNIQTEQIEFLDTQVFFTNKLGEKTKKLATRVFFKETDRHALLHKSSYHPKHTFKGLIKSQLIRFHRICTYPEDVEEATRTLFTALGPRGYSKRFLREIKAEVKQIFKNNGQYIKNQDDRSIIPVVTTYSQTLFRLSSHLKTHFQQAQGGCDDLMTYKVISAYRRNRNLGDILVHSSLTKKLSKSPLQELHSACNKYIVNKHSGLGVPIWQRVHLNTLNVVYVIRCVLCQKLYIGETKNTLQSRLKQHIYHINKGDRTTVLYTHFITHGLEQLKIEGLETNPNWSKAQRQKAERKWIRLLNTIDPKGLNEKF